MQLKEFELLGLRVRGYFYDRTLLLQPVLRPLHQVPVARQAKEVHARLDLIHLNPRGRAECKD